MNRKDGGKGGRTRERALSWSPEENFRERGQGGGRQGWGQGGTGARRNGGKEEAGKAGDKEKRGQGGGDFRSFFGKKRKKEG